MTSGKATLIEKILAAHGEGKPLRPGDMVSLGLDARVARDFGGANVIGNLERAGLEVADPTKTFFTFDCNPGGSDQGYAANQHRLRLYARTAGIRVYDISAGIGTHLAVDEGFAWPGSTLVSTDSHANILGAIGAFGQGMGDLDIAQAFARGEVWFVVPPTVKVILKGRPGPLATPKDISLALLRHFGAAGLLGLAAEITGDIVDGLGLDARLTISSQATEMGAIIALFAPNATILAAAKAAGCDVPGVQPDPGAKYADEITIDITDLGPLVSRPGHPEDVVPLAEVQGETVDSIFIGSCTNGRISDLSAAATVLKGRQVAPGRVLKIVPATDRTWQTALHEGHVVEFKRAGALFANAGCAGCAAGQVGQNGPAEVTVSTGNRNYTGKQGKGSVWLASPAVAAASAVAGYLTGPDAIPEQPKSVAMPAGKTKPETPVAKANPVTPPLKVTGRAWVIPSANIDTDMIYHNRHLAVTDVAEMGKYAFGNLPGWEHYPGEAQPGDIVITGENFGAGSSRQHAVDCFAALRAGAVVAPSFGAIYSRNAINSALPIIKADLVAAGVEHGEEISIDFLTGEITRTAKGTVIKGEPMSAVQVEIFSRGGLLAKE